MLGNVDENEISTKSVSLNEECRRTCEEEVELFWPSSERAINVE